MKRDGKQKGAVRQHSKLGWSPATAEKFSQIHRSIFSLCSTPEKVGGLTAWSVAISDADFFLRAAMYPRCVEVSRQPLSSPTEMIWTILANQNE
jgi:hypothetical protein